MELIELVAALADGDMLTARQWVADAAREGFEWSHVPRPQGLPEPSMAIAAGITELLAARAGQAAPAWTADVRAVVEPVYLVRAARDYPRLRRLCEEEGPEPLRRRRILAPPEFLTAT
jgi:hypothetical protein